MKNCGCFLGVFKYFVLIFSYYRITAKAPYQMMNNYSSKAAAASDQKGTWLGFGQQFPLQMERQV